jgi:hypothetical protein
MTTKTFGVDQAIVGDAWDNGLTHIGIRPLSRSAREQAHAKVITNDKGVCALLDKITMSGR